MAEGDLKPRNPALAGLASFLVPGLGQMYNGQPGLGLVFFLVVYGAAVMVSIRVLGFLLHPESGVAGMVPWIVLSILAWLSGVVQAIFAALDRPDYLLQWYNRGLVYFGILVGLWVVIPIFSQRPMLRFLLARNGVTDPARVAQVLQGLEAARRGESLTPVEPAVPELTVADPEPFNIPDPEVAARDAATVFHVVLVGGQDSGILDAYSNETLCRFSDAPASWTGLYTHPGLRDDLTALQFQVPVETGSVSRFRLSINVGDLPDGRSYVVDPAAARAEASVDRRGAGAVIRLIGTTELGVRVEVTVQCREVG